MHTATTDSTWRGAQPVFLLWQIISVYHLTLGKQLLMYITCLIIGGFLGAIIVSHWSPPTILQGFVKINVLCCLYVVTNLLAKWYTESFNTYKLYYYKTKNIMAHLRYIKLLPYYR